MEKLFAPYHIAKLLKEKNFNEPCLAMYIITTKGGQPEFRYNYAEHGLWFRHNNDGKTKTWNDPNCKCSAPILQQVVDWLLNQHNLVIQVSEQSYEFVEYLKKQGKDPKRFIGCISQNGYCASSDDYYQALIGTIEEALKLI